MDSGRGRDFQLAVKNLDFLFFLFHILPRPPPSSLRRYPSSGSAILCLFPQLNGCGGGGNPKNPFPLSVVARIAAAYSSNLTPFKPSAAALRSPTLGTRREEEEEGRSRKGALSPAVYYS